MNKIYRAIWNETTQTWVAASELAKSKTKSDTVSSLPATSQTSSKRRFAAIFKLSLVASFLNLSLLAPNVYASNAALIGGSNMGDNSPTQSYKDKNGKVLASHGSIILNGANDFEANGGNRPFTCGADEVTGRGEPGRTISGTSITALEEYLRFAEDRSYGGKNPYGTTTNHTNAGEAAMQGDLTGGAISKMPVAYGVYSFASGCGSYTSGNYSMAFGTNATATAGGAMAIGTAALASGRASIAFGVGAEATGVSSVALGSVASSNGVGSVAAGLMSQASADGTVALGVQAEAKNNSAVAIGNSAQATGEQSISIGSANQVSGKGSGAIGGSNATTQYDTVNGKQTTAASGVTIVTGDGSYSFGNQNGTIAANNTGVFGNRNTIQTDSEGVNKADNIRILGNNNTVTAQAGGAMIVGNAANVSAANGLALGNNTSVSGANGVAIGAGAIAEDENGVALGSGSVASGNVVAIGNASAGITRQITGLAAGTLDTDAVNVAQLKSLDASTSTSISSLSSSTSTSLSALEDNFTNLSTSTSSSILEATKELKSISTSVDGHISSTGATLTELQTSASASILELRDNALQWNNEVQAYDAAHLASGAKTAKIINVQAGDITTKDSTDAVNGGQLYTTNSNLSSLSLSVSSSINELSDKLVSSNTTDIISLSTMASSIGDTVGKLQKDALQWKDGSYSADHGTDEAQVITNVAAGNTTPNSTDAINGSQLHSLSTVTQTGLSTAASGLSSLSVSTATGLNSLSSSINSSLSNATEGVTELKQNALQWNNNIGAYDAARNGNIQKITNVAAGTVGENSTDAVNAGQLFSLSNSTSTGLSSLSSSLSTITENQMGDMSGTVSRLNENVSSLSTGLSTIDGSVTALQQNALQWNSNISAYDATRGGSTQKLSGIKEGYIAADSTDAINGSQLHSLSTVTQTGLDDAASGLSSLSVSTATGLNSLSSSINSSLSNATEGVTELKQNALQWNNNIGAYDAARNG
ncbi:ESPR-type extended signal peptide-containing protein, partial [Snodgrassella alvi]|uniref:ESPR-type extended signal peptide-containing protein n=1 Tax=Snodgrassella alvi TaxID=1196083 RepID=UPI002147A4D2